MTQQYAYSEFVTTKLDFAKYPVYFLMGNDAHLIERAQLRIRDQLIKKKKVDLVIVYGDETSAGELSELLDVYSLFSDSKLILLRSVEVLKGNALEILANYIDSPLEDQTLIITSSKIDLKTKIWKRIKENSILVNCDPPRHSGDIRLWLDAELSSANKRMDQKAKDEFLSRVELDYSTIDNELQKLFLIVNERSQILESDVDQSLGTTRSGAQSDFYRALGNRNKQKALTLLNNMLSSDLEPLIILFQLNKFYNTMWKIRLLQENHISYSEIISQHLNDLFMSYRSEYIEFSKKLKTSEFPMIFSVLLDTDSKLKLSAASAEVLLSTCLIRILG